MFNGKESLTDFHPAVHGNGNHADARGGNAVYSVTKTGFRVYVHSTTGTGAADAMGVATAGTGITPTEATLWAWHIQYLVRVRRSSSMEWNC